MLIEDGSKNKLEAKSRKMQFMDFPHGVNGYLLYDSLTHKIRISKNVVFDERAVLG